MNISCETCRERWDELFNDSPQGASQSEATQDSELAGVREHLAQCAQCRSEFALLKAAREELHAFPALMAPLDLRARIRQQLEAEAAASVIPATVPEPVMTPEEVARHRAQLESKILENTGRASSGSRLKVFWLRFQRNLRHPAAMALSSGAALLLICFVSLNTFQPAQTPQEMPSPVAVMQAEPKEEVQSERTRSKDQERLTAKTRKAAPARAASKEDTSRPSTPGRKDNSTKNKPTVANGAEAELPVPRNDGPAIWKVTPPPPQPPQPLPQGERSVDSPEPAISAPVSPIPAAPRDENAGKAAFKVQPAPLPAPGTMAAPQNATPKSTSPAAAMMARESQDTVAEGDRGDNARGPAGPPQAAMAQRSPELRAMPDKSSPSKRYLARGRGMPERIEASITAPRHIGNAEVVVELPEEAQFSDGSRSRVLWRGSVRKNESIAVNFEAEVEPEAEDARVVLKETRDGETETVAYKDVPVSEAGRRRSR